MKTYYFKKLTTSHNQKPQLNIISKFKFSVFTHVTISHDNRCYPPCWSTTKRKQTPRDLLFCLGIAQKHRYFHHGLMFNGELSL